MLLGEESIGPLFAGIRFQRDRPYAYGSWPAGDAVDTHFDRIHLAPSDTADGIRSAASGRARRLASR